MYFDTGEGLTASRILTFIFKFVIGFGEIGFRTNVAFFFQPFPFLLVFKYVQLDYIKSFVVFSASFPFQGIFKNAKLCVFQKPS